MNKEMAKTSMRKRLEDLISSPSSRYDVSLLERFEKRDLPIWYTLRLVAAASAQDGGGTLEERQEWIRSLFPMLREGRDGKLLSRILGV